MLGLKPVPSEKWQKKFDEVMSDPYVAKKYDRERRIRDKRSFIAEWCEEVASADQFESPYVLDIGPGPGEFLEVAREYGNRIVGIDAATGDGGMGDAYLRLSKLMHKRQGLEVYHCGLDGFIFGGQSVIPLNSLSFICSQGSIEQCFCDYMVGVPHDKHHDCKQLAWKEDNSTLAHFRFTLDLFRELLVEGGALVIWANGAANTQWYLDAMHRVSRDIHWPVIAQKDTCLKWKKGSNDAKSPADNEKPQEHA